jgi:pyruvate/2-oxoglutarate dehydrogenase complex dihydrolipoamide dehydrogenase (E3) component
VTLIEVGAQLGGQALLAQRLPGRAEFGGIITNLSRELELAGVEVRLNTRADADMIAGLAPEAVILATGAQPYIPPEFHAEDDAHVVTAWQVLQNEVNPGGSVVIADWRSDWIGLGLAELLASNGARVRLAVNGTHAGELLQSYVRDSMISRCHMLGVEIIPYARLFGADSDTAYFQHSASGEALVLDGVDTLVLTQGHAPDTALSAALAKYAGETYEIGDCRAPRTAEEAVLEGLRVAARI